MHFLTWYRINKKKWWALPLILPSLLLPFAAGFNAYTVMDGGRVFLLYLSMSLLTAFVMLFGWASLPGIILALLIRYIPLHEPVIIILAVLQFLVPTLFSWVGYRFFVPRRNAVAFGYWSLVGQRLFWLVLVNSTISLILYQLGLLFGWFDKDYPGFITSPWNVRTLINYQAILVGSLVGLPFFYFIVRMIVSPHFIKVFWYRMLGQRQKGVSFPEMLLWAAIVIVLMGLLLFTINDASTIFNTDYTLMLIFPLMLWGAMRFGFLFINNVWAVMLIILCAGFHNYLPADMGFELHLAIASSCYAIFSITICLMSSMTTQQRFLYSRTRRVAFIDPMMQMPNMRALRQDLTNYSWSTLGFITIPELGLLGRNYGALLCIQYKQQLAEHLRSELSAGETVYNLASDDLVVRVDYHLHRVKIEAIYERIKSFRLIWDGMPLQLQVGISYCSVRNPVSHLYLLLGELSTMAGRSLATLHPESLQQRGANQVQNAVKRKVAMMNQLQRAIDNSHFSLTAQRVEGARGDVYHEVLLHMVGDNGELINPDVFLPVAHEFGLASRIDLWMLNSILEYMDRHRNVIPGSRFAINLTPASICRAQLPGEVMRLLSRHHVEPWQLIFEATEINSLTNFEQADVTLQALQRMGCRVMLGDFGASYASYARLKELSADMLKMDGGLIRNILTSSLDYQMVSSICQLAKVKKMQVVAEYVETEEIKAAVKALGVDYMQGQVIGRPQSLDSLAGETASPQHIDSATEIMKSA